MEICGYIELKGIVDAEAINIIGITESWANREDSAILRISGFTIFRDDRINKKGGGVLIYVRDSIFCSELKLNCKPEGIESVLVKLNNDNGRGLIVGNIYKPPVSSEQQDRDMYKCSRSLS